MTLKFNPLAELLPLLEGVEFAVLVDDIKTHGLREPITLHPDGSILDGRNRYRACLEAGIDPVFTRWDSPDTVSAFIISKNLVRRHLNASQRAMVAAKLATYEWGGDRSKVPIGPLKINEAAQLLNVGARSVKRAKKVLDNAAPEVCEAVERGELSLSRAVAMMPRRERIIDDGGISKQKQYAMLWRQLRDGLEKITGLPDSEEIANKIVPAAQRDLVSRKLPIAIEWLQSFNQAWERKMR